LKREYRSLIAVFGSAGGGRDTWKRPELGKIADEFCDQIYLTTDDSYDEKTEYIIDDIKKGIRHQQKVSVIIDRAQAIAEAVRAAGPNDIVAITGMGSQTHTYGPKGVKIPWSDRKAVEKALKEVVS
jgi:UDP-N-acetylmuramoyl-L-alanyl-D-glutamate--2,6-diaminopimelate ligase